MLLLLLLFLLHVFFFLRLRASDNSCAQGSRSSNAQADKPVALRCTTRMRVVNNKLWQVVVAIICSVALLHGYCNKWLAREFMCRLLHKTAASAERQMRLAGHVWYIVASVAASKNRVASSTCSNGKC